ncbi:LysE family translocator [Shimia marina]|nr:LysE family translocator [Shimia marina]
MTWEIWMSFAWVSAANIVTPGPANMNTLRRAVQLGGWQVIPTIMGNALGLAIGGFITAYGVAALVLSSPPLWALLNYTGVAYLVWLGLKLLCAPRDADLREDNVSTQMPRKLFIEGLLLALTNPKALLFYVALFPQVMQPISPVGPQAALLVSTYCGLSIMSLSLYATFANSLRAFFATPTHYQRFRQGSGVILITFALNLVSWA